MKKVLFALDVMIPYETYFFIIFQLTAQILEWNSDAVETTTDDQGIFIPPDFLEGRPAYFDVSVRNTFLPQYIVNLLPMQEDGEKDDKYGSDVSATSGLFYPLVVESLGH